ncbi:lysophospholipid acyltransferase family protein [Alloyangia pacifica]|uniref:KDO2-lipid IV(A) lauroyltransferase n=1 Tax=Alloyangia pacifica TaxID=311180 RepID=A0A1I6PBZ0_9RHOB|nr:lysophospholipid acyltransferase family protein [Alloyangia pacifica]SDG24144.1 KDO2-lipid IV(A) lauroyltransferase [Alloyangia pacifica]SFS37660.1 KDO2-lipid IV(A) lauroyltransferase [Alloyangia pacifica]
MAPAGQAAARDVPAGTTPAGKRTPAAKPPAETVKARGGWADYLSDKALRAMIRLSLMLPPAARGRLMATLISKLVAPLAGYDERAMTNLAHVWPDMPESDRRRIAREVAQNAGRTMIENYDVPGLLARMKDTPVTGAGVAAIEAARAEGRPILFVTGHYGNFEAPRAALVARGWRIGGLYRPMANPFFNEHYAANMHALSDPVFEQGRRGTMGLLKHIRSGGMGVLLFDVYDSAGVPIDFLGQPAPTLTSAAEIAVKTGALFVPFFGIRKPDGVNFEAVFEEPIAHGDPVEMMREVTRRLEARVEADPGQWFWIHRRWKPKRQRRQAEKRARQRSGG